MCHLAVAADEREEVPVPREECLHTTGGPRMLLWSPCLDAALLLWGTSLHFQQHLCTSGALTWPKCGSLYLWLKCPDLSIQEWEYAYVHSFYHLSLVVSFVLLLPKKNRYAGTGRNAAKLKCYTLCCCVWHNSLSYQSCRGDPCFKCSWVQGTWIIIVSPEDI